MPVQVAFSGIDDPVDSFRARFSQSPKPEQITGVIWGLWQNFTGGASA
jgi:hypothetical protein